MNEKVIVVDEDGSFVHFGELLKVNFNDVTLVNHRILYKWKGSLQSLASNGVVNPKKCVFSDFHPTECFIGNAQFIIPCSEKAAKSITEIPHWIKTVKFPKNNPFIPIVAACVILAIGIAIGLFII